MKTSVVITVVALLASVAATAAGAFDLRFVGGLPQVYAQPDDLALSPDGRLLYVADNNNRIAVVNPVTRTLRGRFGEAEIGAPHDVAFDSDGRLLVANTDNSRFAIY